MGQRWTDPFESSAGTAVAEEPALAHMDRTKPILVTGASGLVGTHACRELSRRGWTIRALVRDPLRATSRLGACRCEMHVGDLRDPGVIEAAVRGVGAIVHLAAIATERRGEKYEHVNAEATGRLLAAACLERVDRFIHLSMNGATRRSSSRFVRSKAAGEAAVRESGLQWTVFRPSLIFGPEDVFANALARLVRLMPLVMPLPRVARDASDRRRGAARFQPVSVDDVARAVADALERRDSTRAVYAIGGPVALTLEQMMERVFLAMGVRRRIVTVPASVLRPIAQLAERVLPNPPVTTTHLEMLSVDSTVPRNDLKEVFGLLPAPFAAEELMYLRRVTVGDALRSLFRRS